MEQRKQVLRTRLSIADNQTVAMHPGGEILSVAYPRDGRTDAIDMWFTSYPFTPEHTESTRTVHVVGTGDERPDGRFVGTVVTPSGLVWHVFEQLPPTGAEIDAAIAMLSAQLSDALPYSESAYAYLRELKRLRGDD